MVNPQNWLAFVLHKVVLPINIPDGDEVGQK
jgi:hypothetical protein